MKHGVHPLPPPLLSPAAPTMASNLHSLCLVLGVVAADEAVANGHPHHDDDDRHHHHDDHRDHGPADAGAYVTLAVDFLHNVIDGIGCVGSSR